MKLHDSILFDYIEPHLSAMKARQSFIPALNQLGCNIFWTDTEGRALGCNQIMLDMLQLPLDEYVGRTNDELAELCHIPQWVMQKLCEDDRYVIASKKPLMNIEDPPYILPDGRLRYFLTSRWPLVDDITNEVWGVCGLSFDITPMKLALARDASIRHLQAFYVTAKAHDQRTLIHNMKDQFLLLKQSHLNVEQQTAVCAIESAAELLDGYASDVMYFSNDSFERDYMSVSMIDLFIELKEKFQGSCRIRQIELYYANTSALTKQIECNREALERILHGLVSNSINYLENGTIACRFECCDTVNDCVSSVKKWMLSITDTGPGMPKEFQQFLHDEHLEKHPSNRIGLKMVKHYVYSVLNGKIHVESFPEEGTIVKITFHAPEIRAINH